MDALFTWLDSAAPHTADSVAFAKESMVLRSIFAIVISRGQKGTGILGRREIQRLPIWGLLIFDDKART